MQAQDTIYRPKIQYTGPTYNTQAQSTIPRAAKGNVSRALHLSRASTEIETQKRAGAQRRQIEGARAGQAWGIE